MIDEGELRQRFPEIPWDQPVRLVVTGGEGTSYYGWACRYCIATHGLRASDAPSSEYVFQTREDALDHVEKVHHD
jgi:hypothetical protein